MNCFDAVSSWWRSHGTWRMVYLLFLGQLVSFVMALMSFSSSLIADLGVDAPLTQMFFAYLALALVFGSILIYRRRRLLVSWYWYLLLGMIDVQGNYLVNEAYQYSSITSVTLFGLLDNSVGPSPDLGVYRNSVFAVAVVWSRIVCSRPWLSASVRRWSGRRRWFKTSFGRHTCYCRDCLLCLKQCREEFCVKKKDLVEVVSMIGLYGTLVSVVEISIFERESIESITWSTELVLAFVGYTLSTFAFYSVAPTVLKMSGAAMFNLSLLTSDMWAVVVRIFIYQQQVDWLYYLAFAIVVVGLVIYSNNEKGPEVVHATEDGNVAHYQVLSNGSAVSPEESSPS